MEFETTPQRTRQLDDLAEALPRRAALLAHLFLKHTTLGVSRTDIGVLHAASERPQRITDLAAAEGVTQPAITLVVNRLARRGWVTRQPDASDGRAVLVALTEAGCTAYDEIRAEYRALMHEEMATLDDEAVEVLGRAIDVLDELIERLTEREP
ncbi:MAG: MarR family transcriptional regulator [Acidobacteriota bacterium]|nr:MarR family transcriptional regulator [Acidobacteriota bacterium]